MKPIKCLVWDLDDTLWQGSLLEGGTGALRVGAREAVVALDARGVLQSIASQSDPEAAPTALARNEIDAYFLHPQIDPMGDKQRQLEKIADALGIGLDAVAFIDDCPHQRAYVEAMLPEVLVLAPDDLAGLPELACFEARYATSEAARRRQLYVDAQQREAASAGFVGRRAAFMASCALRAELAPAAPADAARIAELVERTHRFHAAVRRPGQAEIEAAIAEGEPHWTVLRLRDRFGDHGLVGASLLNVTAGEAELGALVISCRVQGRGVGDALLRRAIVDARAANATGLVARYTPNARNRAMALLFARFGCTRDQAAEGEQVAFRHALSEPPALPAWLTVDAA